MKLYDLPRNSYFRLLSDEKVPPDAPQVISGEVYWLGNIDGMYSFCKDSSGNVCHIAAYSTVELLS